MKKEDRKKTDRLRNEWLPIEFDLKFIALFHVAWRDHRHQLFRLFKHIVKYGHFCLLMLYPLAATVIVLVCPGFVSMAKKQDGILLLIPCSIIRQVVVVFPLLRYVLAVENVKLRQKQRKKLFGKR